MKIQEVLNQELEIIKPTKNELRVLKQKVDDLLKELNSNINKYSINAKIFIGGSYAKGTLIKKNRYDVDVFIRFDKSYAEVDLVHLLKKIIPKNAVKLHGSRDYFRIRMKELDFEIIPCLSINKPEQARNVTDLSYFHVNYLKKQVKKNPKLCDEIRLAKAFTYYQECYGAESYINGFSGYGLELLISYYKSFLKFIQVVAKANLNKKIIIDPESFFKTKEDILTSVNSSKLLSPIVFIDPTFKERNALAALSYPTLKKFQGSCKAFLRSPSLNFFKLKDKELELKKKYGERLLKVEMLTNRQAGDIAGTKLKKFASFFIRELEIFFKVKDSDFIYDENRNLGNLFFVVVPKDKIEIEGPSLKMKKRLEAFKKAHKGEKILNKKGKAFVIREIHPKVTGFLSSFKKAKKKTISEMGIVKLDLS